MPKETRHGSLNLKGALNFKRSLRGLFTLDNGKLCSDKEAKEYINDCIAKGWISIPLCKQEECPDFDYFGGGCPGHPVKE